MSPAAPENLLASGSIRLAGSGPFSITASSHVSDSHTSNGQSSPATSDDRSSDLANGNQSLGFYRASDKGVGLPGGRIALDIFPASRLKALYSLE